jgi:hypothetical protein
VHSIYRFSFNAETGSLSMANIPDINLTLEIGVLVYMFLLGASTLRLGWGSDIDRLVGRDFGFWAII